MSITGVCLLQSTTGAATQAVGCLSALPLQRLAIGLRLQPSAASVATTIYLRQWAEPCASSVALATALAPAAIPASLALMPC